MHSKSLSAEQLRGILDIADDAIICTNERQEITLFNQGAERIFGWKAEEVLGQLLTLLLPPRHRPGHGARMEQFRDSPHTARRMAERQVIHAVRKDGTEFPAEASISKLHGGDGLVYTAILRDVSARKAYEEELEKAREKAEAAMQAKSMFLANMSHEIRTPLNAVIGMTSLLLNTPIDEEQRDYTETIRSSSEVLLAIINDLLDYSKIEIGKLEIERHPFDLRRCIEEAMDLLASSAGEKGIDLAYLIEENVPAVILADAARLRQILVNLISNAIKFTHYGEVVVSVTAEQQADQFHEIRIAVKDTGIGIPEDRLRDIFESFTQVDASTTRKYGGTGLGLAISKRLAEYMGGNITVSSVLGQGSSFVCTLRAEAAGQGLAQHVLQDRSGILAGKRMLIVDDNSTNRRILVKQALLWGMIPSAAASAIEALDLVRHGHAFDIGVLDMSMPEMDGLQLALEIRKFRDARALPLVMLTSVMHRSRNHLAEAEFAAHLNKPIKPSALFDVLLHALALDPPPQPEPEVRSAPPVSTDVRPLTILVAEDNTINQKVIKQLLLRIGYRADLVGNGLEALQAAERQPYDVILMDVQMPEMDGLEATRRLRQRQSQSQDAPPAPYIIAMTANAMPGDKEKCFAAGVDAYVPKPVELADLRSALIDAAEVVAVRAIGDMPVIDQRRFDHLTELQDPSNPHLLRELVASFIEETPRHLQTLQDAVQANDAALVARAAHYLQSSIEFLGLSRMREPCRQLEQLGKQDALAEAPAIHARLLREFERAKARLSELARQ